MSPLQDPDALLWMLVAHEEATAVAARDIADAGTDRMKAETQRRTPIDTNPFRHKPERPRGTARESIHRRPGIEDERRGTFTAYIGTVESFDPVVGIIELDRLPHTIRARDGGFLRFQSRHGFTDRDGHAHPPGTWVTVREVNHPGTKGTHAFQLGALDAELAIDEYALPVLERWRYELAAFR